MAIQIEQKFPRCRRCGRMIHFRAERIEAVDHDGATIVLCSDICRDEYAALFGLADAGERRVGTLAGRREV
jgi:hypothetical protein